MVVKVQEINTFTVDEDMQFNDYGQEQPAKGDKWPRGVGLL